MRRTTSRGAPLLASLLLGSTALLAATASPVDAQEAEGTTPTIVLAIEEGNASERRQTRILREGAADAAEDQGVTLEVRELRRTVAARVELLDRVLAARPDGLVLAAADPMPLADPIRAAGTDKIPVVLTWAGIRSWRDLGAVAYVGVDQTEAGRLAGTRLAELGATNVLCAVDDVVDVRLDERCAGALAALEEAGGRMDLLRALDPPGDPTGVRDAIASRLFGDPTFDAVLATEDDTARWAVEALTRTDRRDRVRLATFDPAPAIVSALADGQLAFAVDTQPYLQGYLPVLFLSQWARRGLMPGGGEPILTGPRLLTREDAARRLEIGGS